MRNFTILLCFMLLLLSYAGAQDGFAGIAPGRYGCTASKMSGGTLELIPRGYLTLSADGTYLYEGFESPSRGTYAPEGAGRLSLSGGYLDGGEAEKIDRPNKFFLTFPACPDRRWTCTLIED